MAEENVDLLNAIREGNSQEAIALIESYDASSGLLGGYSLLRMAVQTGEYYIAKLLLDRGCPVSASERDGLLHLAAENRDFDMAKLFLENGADVDSKNQNGETPLLIAVEKADWLVELLLKHGADVNADLFNAIREGNLQETTRLIDSPDESASSGLLGGYSPLRLAVDMNHVDIVELLLDRGYPVNASENVPYSVLHLAAKNGNVEMVELLLKKGADVNGDYPLSAAVRRRHLRIVELLLNSGADVNAEVQNGWTPLYLNSDNYIEDRDKMVDYEYPLQLEIAKLLLRKGANVNAQTKGGATTLLASIGKASCSLVEHLLKCNADVNLADNCGFTPLHVSAINGRTEIACLLLAKGVDVNRKTNTGKTALSIAVERGRLQMVNLLLNSGAEVNVISEVYWGATPLHLTAYHNREICGDYVDYEEPVCDMEIVQIEITKLLLSKGANINAQVDDGRTALYLSIYFELFSLADFFLRQNADINLVNRDGLTALHYAASSGSQSLVSSILAKGADVNAKSFEGLTPLHEAVKYKKGVEAIEVLLANGANVNCLDTRGFSPLHHLAEVTDFKVGSTLLLNWGADLNCKTDKGKTPLHIAAVRKNAEFVKFLLENGAKVNCQDENGESPLHRARDPMIIDTLVEFGARVDSRSKNGLTPLHVGSSLCRSVAVAALLENGADVNIRCNLDRTPLDWTHFEGELRDQDDRGGRFDRTQVNFTRHVLLLHQAAMQAVGLHVEESEFSARHEGKLKRFRKSCQEEVLLLKREFIDGTTVSYYDLVRKDVRFLARYMDNENVVQAAELEEYRSKFPTYASVIKSKFRRGRARNKLLKAANQVLNQQIDLPDYCMDKIMDYLCDDGLLVLIDV